MSFSVIQLSRRLCFVYPTHVTQENAGLKFDGVRTHAFRTHSQFLSGHIHEVTLIISMEEFNSLSTKIFKVTTGTISEMQKFSCDFEDPTTDEKIATTEMSLKKITPS